MRGRALVIATGRYSDPTLSELQATWIDAAGLKEVLAHEHVGDLNVTTCIDETCQSWRERIDTFFSEATHAEFLLLYISGHAIKDRDGNLYFAARDTRVNGLLSTGIPATLIQNAAANSRSHQITMIFDTCFSGAFAKGFQFKSDRHAFRASEYFRESKGTVVITASDALQYALAGDSVEGSAAPSLFSKHVIEGLRSGAADMDGDGFITSVELVEYVSGELRKANAHQRPQRWAFHMSGDFVIASNPHPRPGTLPEDVLQFLRDARPEVRGLAVDKLVALLRDRNASIALAAREALDKLAEDDSRAVAKVAAAALGRTVSRHDVTATHPKAPEKKTEKSSSIHRPVLLSIAITCLGLLGFAYQLKKSDAHASWSRALAEPLDELPGHPHVTQDQDRIKPAPGYRWVNKADGDYRVYWHVGSLHPVYRKLIAAPAEGEWVPAHGYSWVDEQDASKLAVHWKPGMPHPEHKNVIAGDTEGQWRPASGFKWADAASAKFDVVPVNN